MRIQSNFKDYYDAGMASGQDQTLVYRRYVEEEKLEFYPFPAAEMGKSFYRGDPDPELHAHSCMIGFCGTVYPLLIVYPANLAHGKGREARDSRKLIYNIEELDNYILANYGESKYEDYCSTKYRKHAIWPTWHRRLHFVKFLDSAAQIKDKHKHRFEDRRCPIFIAEYTHKQQYPWWDAQGKHQPQKDKPYQIIYHGCLKDYEFYRVFDTHAAYQEIAMWLGNQAESHASRSPRSATRRWQRSRGSTSSASARTRKSERGLYKRGSAK